MAIEESHQILRRWGVAVERGLGPALEQFVLGKIGIAGQEIRIGSEREIVALGQIFPLPDNLVHAGGLLRDEAAASPVLRLRNGGEGQRGTGHQCE